MELEMDDAPISVTLIKPHSINTPYPEHARNKMDEPARVPPTVYDPRLVAKAICFGGRTSAARPHRRRTGHHADEGRQRHAAADGQGHGDLLR